MAQTGVYSPTAIQEVELIVRVNGVYRPVDSVRWGGDTSGGLPDQIVAAGTGMRSRTGEIRWATPALSEEAPHPLNRVDGWPPREGDRVEIDAVVGGVTFRRFTGRLGVTTGSLVDSTLTSDITDTLSDSLSRQVSVEPRLTGASGSSYRAAWEAIEQAGLGLLPPAEGEGDIIIQHTPQGDTYATIGDSVDDSAAVRLDDPYGIQGWNYLEVTPLVGPTRAGRSILILGRSIPSLATSVITTLTDGTIFVLRRQTDNTLQAYVNGVLEWEGAWEGEGIPILAMRVSFGWLEIYTSTTTTQQVITDSFNVGVRDVYGLGLSAVQVRYGLPSTLNQMVADAPTWPTAVRMGTIPQGRVRATRGFENVPASTVVDAWGSATLSSCWMDELGRSYMVARDYLLQGGVARQVQVDERIFNGVWSIGDDGVYRTVVVGGQVPAVRGAIGPAEGQPNARFRVTIWSPQQARGYDEPTIDEETFIEAPPEVDWGPVDLSPAVAGTNWVGGELNGSWQGSVVTDAAQGSDFESWSQILGVIHTTTVERLGHRTLKLTETVDNIPAGETVYLKTTGVSGTNVHRAMRDRPTPYFRAMWATTWADFVRSATLGPAYAPTYEHDASWWLTTTDAQRLANALAAEVAQPVPTFSNIGTLWDPRRQIGDIERWFAVDGDGNTTWEANVMVVGYDESWSDGIPSQTVSVRTVSMADPNEGKTYLDLAAAYSTYAGMAGNTYQQIADALPGAA